MDRIEAMRAYVRLVERGSFTAVAGELRVKQSTVSKWIAALERELGARLMDRTTRSSHVTEEGQRFYVKAREVLDAYERAVGAVGPGDGRLRGRVRMNVPVVFGRRFVVPIVADFLREHPDVEMELSFDDDYVNLVGDGHDLSVRIGEPVDSSLQGHALGSTQRRVVASPAYLRAHGEPRTVQALSQHQCLLHNRLSAGAVWTFSRGDLRQRVKVGGRVAADNSEAAAALAREGLGICMLADWLVDHDIQAGRLVSLLDEHAPLRAPVSALTPPGRRIPRRVQALIDALRDGLFYKLSSGVDVFAKKNDRPV